VHIFSAAAIANVKKPQRAILAAGKVYLFLSSRCQNAPLFAMNPNFGRFVAGRQPFELPCGNTRPMNFSKSQNILLFEKTCRCVLKIDLWAYLTIF